MEWLRTGNGERDRRKRYVLVCWDSWATRFSMHRHRRLFRDDRSPILRRSCWIHRHRLRESGHATLLHRPAALEQWWHWHSADHLLLDHGPAVCIGARWSHCSSGQRQLRLLPGLADGTSTARVESLGPCRACSRDSRRVGVVVPTPKHGRAGCCGRASISSCSGSRGGRPNDGCAQRGCSRSACAS